MPKTDGIVFEVRRLDLIIARMDDAARALVQDAALEVEARAKANTVRVDTGAMRRGWHATKLGDLYWRVAAGVDYAIYHEHGTSRLSASPMLGPAVEAVRALLPRWSRRVFGG